MHNWSKKHLQAFAAGSGAHPISPVIPFTLDSGLEHTTQLHQQYRTLHVNFLSAKQHHLTNEMEIFYFEYAQGSQATFASVTIICSAEVGR